MTTAPLVSIGIPVYNGEKYLEETLDSAVGQTYENLEIVVADNASTDATPAILERYAAADPRVRVITNERNVGAAGNYNLVLGEARGERFAWLSADDVLEPTYIEQLSELLDRRPDAVGAYAQAIRIDADSAHRGDYREAMAGLGLDDPSAAQRFSGAVLGFPAIVLFGLWRRDVLLATPGHGAFIGGDRVLVSEMALRGPIVSVDDLLFQRRVHDDAYSALLDTDDKVRWFAGEDATERRPDLNRIREHLRALERSAPDRSTRVRGTCTLVGSFPLVLLRSRAANGYERVLTRFGRSVDRGRYAG